MRIFLIFISLFYSFVNELLAQETNDFLFPIIEKEQYGFINKKGEIVVPPSFTITYGFENGLAEVRKEKECEYKHINFKGEYVPKPKCTFTKEEYESIPKNEIDPLDQLISAAKYLGKDEEWPCRVIQSKIKELKPKTKHYQIVDTLNGRGFIDKRNGKILPLLFDEVDYRGFENGLCLVIYKGVYSYIDTNCTLVWKQKQALNNEPHVINLNYKPILNDIYQELKPSELNTQLPDLDSNHIGLFLTILPDTNVWFSKKYKGKKVKIANLSPYLEDTIHFSRKFVYFSLEVFTKNNKWENLISNKSGLKNSYEIGNDRSIIKMLPQQYWTFTVPTMEGCQKSKCRYIAHTSAGETISETFDCSYNEEQLGGNSSNNFLNTSVGRGLIVPGYIGCGFGFKGD
jgi:hypothetical protein